MRNSMQRYFYSLLLACITLGALGMELGQEEPDESLGLVEKNIRSYLKSSDMRPGRYLQSHLFEEMPPLELVRTIKNVETYNFSNDESTMAVKTNNALHVYDVATGVLRLEIPIKSADCRYVLNHNGSVLLVKMSDRELRLYTITVDNAKYITLPVGYRNYTKSNDGSTIAVQSPAGFVFIDATTGKRLSNTVISSNNEANYALSNNGTTFLKECWNDLKFYDTKTGELRACLPYSRKGLAVRRYKLLVNESKVAVQKAGTQTLEIYDVNSGEQCGSVTPMLPPKKLPIFSNDASMILVEFCNFLTVYEVKTGRKCLSVDTRGDFVFNAQYELTPDGSSLVFQGANRTDVDDTATSRISVYDTATGEVRFRSSAQRYPFGGNDKWFLLSPDGSKLIYHDSYGTEIKVHDIKTGKQYASIIKEEHDKPLKFSSDGSELLVESRESETFLSYDVTREIIKGKIPWYVKESFFKKNKKLKPGDRAEIESKLTHGKAIVLEKFFSSKKTFPQILSIYNENSSELHAFLKQFVDVKDDCFSPKMMQARQLIRGLNYILWMRQAAKKDMNNDNPKWQEVVRIKDCLFRGEKDELFNKKYPYLFNEDGLYEKDEDGVMRRTLPQLEFKPEYREAYLEVYNDPKFFPERIRKCLESVIAEEERFYTAPSSPVGEFLDECLVKAEE